MPILTEKRPETTRQRGGGRKVLLVLLLIPLVLMLAVVLAPLPSGEQGVRLGPFWFSSSHWPFDPKRPYYHPFYWSSENETHLKGTSVYATVGTRTYRRAVFYDPRGQLGKRRN